MRAAVALLLVFALAWTIAARAQSEVILDDAQRAAIREYYQKQAQQAADAEGARRAEQQQQTGKAPAKKKAEKSKKPAAPKPPDKGQGKDKGKYKGKDRNKADGKTADQARPAPQTAQRNLGRGQVLPQDLPRRALPKALDSQLGRPAPGTQRVIVGDDLMLIERKTGRILDVMADVAKNLGPRR